MGEGFRVGRMRVIDAHSGWRISI